MMDGTIVEWHGQNMRITVEISDSDMKEICRVMGEKKKRLAIRKLVEETLMLKRRAAFADKFISGEWGVELKGYEAAQLQVGRKKMAVAETWRE